MKKFLLTGLFILGACTAPPHLENGVVVVSIRENSIKSKTAIYTIDDRSPASKFIDFYDVKGKFNIGDTLVFVKK